jgi:hypothetical protein
MGIAKSDEAGAYNRRKGICYSWDVKKRKASKWKTQRLHKLLPLLLYALG